MKTNFFVNFVSQNFSLTQFILWTSKYLEIIEIITILYLEFCKYCRFLINDKLCLPVNRTTEIKWQARHVLQDNSFSKPLFCFLPEVRTCSSAVVWNSRIWTHVRDQRHASLGHYNREKGCQQVAQQSRKHSGNVCKTQFRASRITTQRVLSCTEAGSAALKWIFALENQRQLCPQKDSDILWFSSFFPVEEVKV